MQIPIPLIFPKVPQSSLNILRVPQEHPPPLEHLPENQRISPENWWLEGDSFPFKMVPFQGTFVNFRGYDLAKVLGHAMSPPGRPWSSRPLAVWKFQSLQRLRILFQRREVEVNRALGWKSHQKKHKKSPGNSAIVSFLGWWIVKWPEINGESWPPTREKEGHGLNHQTKYSWFTLKHKKSDTYFQYLLGRKLRRFLTFLEFVF